MFQTHKGLGNPYGSDTIDIRSIIDVFLKRWYYLLLGVVIGSAFGLYKAYSSEPIFRVKSKAILGNPNEDIDKRNSSIRVEDIYDDKSNIDDKIGVLKSYNLLKETVTNLNVGVSYISKSLMKKETRFFPGPFTIIIDSSQTQVVGLEFYVKKEEDGIRVRGKGDDVWLYNYDEMKGVTQMSSYTIDNVFPLNGDTVHIEDSNLKLSLVAKAGWLSSEEDDLEYGFKLNSVGSVVGQVKGGLSIESVGEESNIINIFLEGADVGFQIDFINELLACYKRKELSQIREIGEREVAFLDSLIRDLTGEIKTTSDEINGQRGPGGLNAQGTDGQLLQNLMRLESEKRDLEASYSYYNGIKQRIEESDTDEAIQLPTSQLGSIDQGLILLINNLSSYQEEKAKLEVSGTIGPKWEVNKIQIENTKNAILANVSSSMEGITIKVNNLLEQINEIRVARGLVPIRQSRIDILSADRDLKSEQLVNLLNRKFEADLSLQKADVEIEILEDPRIDGGGPIKPKKPLIMLMYILVGFLIPSGAIFIFDYFDNRIKGNTDIQSSTNLPVLGYIARHDRNSNYIVPKGSRTALAESFRAIRIKMQYLNDNIHQQVIGATSSTSGEGKTFCVTNLAAVLAQSGKKTLLMDMDLRRPRVTRYFDNVAGIGLSNYLAGEIEDHKSIIFETHIENLSVIHSGPVASSPSDLLTSERMVYLVEEARKQFDYIVFDAPPLGLVSDYLVIMKLTDFNIYIVRDSTTTSDQLNMINELYDTEKISNIAMLINDVRSIKDYGYIDKHYGYGE